MTDKKTQLNPYGPPAARLDPPVAAASDALFFTASAAKFAIMSIATFSIYDLYWFYKNWHVIRARTNRSIMPFWRAFFAVIWSYGCFKEIALATDAADSRTKTSVLLAILYFVLNFAARAPDPYWLITIATFAPVMVANGWAREANERDKPGYAENSSFSAWNWVAIVLGFLLLAVSLVGLFVADTR